jgi:hypothetical protein
LGAEWEDVLHRDKPQEASEHPAFRVSGFSTEELSTCSEAFPRGAHHGDTKRWISNIRIDKEREESNVGGFETPKPERHCDSSMCIVSF